MPPVDVTAATAPLRSPAPAAAAPRRRTRLAAVALAALAVGSLAAFLVLALNGGVYGRFTDVTVYREAAVAWLHGEPLYTLRYTVDQLPFTYPPSGLLALLWLAAVPATATAQVAVVVNVVLLVGLCALVVRVGLAGRPGAPSAAGSPIRDRLLAGLAGVRDSGRPTGLGGPVVLGTALLAGAAAWSEPVRLTVGYGQVNLGLALLVALDVLVVPPRWRGVLTGLAGAVKLTPMIFLLLFLVTGDRRAALRTVLAAAGAAVLAAVLSPGSSWRFWTTIVWTNTTGRPWFTANQSLTGAAERVLRDGPAVGPVVAVASVVAVAVGGVGVRAAWRAGWPVTATATCGLVGLLVSPVSWSHHWVWTTPLVAGIVLEVGTTALGVVAAALGVTVSVGAHWALPQWDTRELSWTWWMQLVGNGYVWLGLVTLGAVTAAGVRATHRWRAPRRRPRDGDYPTGTGGVEYQP